MGELEEVRAGGREGGRELGVKTMTYSHCVWSKDVEGITVVIQAECVHMKKECPATSLNVKSISLRRHIVPVGLHGERENWCVRH